MIDFYFYRGVERVRVTAREVDTLDAAKRMAVILLDADPGADEVRFVWWPEEFTAARIDGVVHIQARKPG